MAAKLSTHAESLLAAVAELPADERRAVAAALEDKGSDEVVAEATMGSAARMLDSSREVLAQALASAERVNDELARGWFVPDSAVRRV
jgi:hypothetical protein